MLYSTLQSPLQVRVRELRDVVDRFVMLEAGVTFQVCISVGTRAASVLACAARCVTRHFARHVVQTGAAASIFVR